MFQKLTALELATGGAREGHEGGGERDGKRTRQGEDRIPRRAAALELPCGGRATGPSGSAGEPEVHPQSASGSHKKGRRNRLEGSADHGGRGEGGPKGRRGGGRGDLCRGVIFGGEGSDRGARVFFQRICCRIRRHSPRNRRGHHGSGWRFS